MTQDQMAAAFNEWMRRFTEEPEAYEQLTATVKRFLAEQSAGEEPSYGAWCAAYLKQIAEEMAS